MMTNSRMTGTEMQVRSCSALPGHHIYLLGCNIAAQELHYFATLQGRWENPCNAVEQIKMLDESRSLSSF